MEKENSLVNKILRLRRLSRELQPNDTAEWILKEEKALYDELFQEVEKDDAECLAALREELKNCP